MMVDPHTAEVTHVPRSWPPSEEANWFNRQVEATARDIQNEDVDAWYG